MPSNATAIGTPDYPNGKFGQCLSVDGTSCLQLPSGGPQEFAANTNWAVEGWFRTASTNAISIVVGQVGTDTNYFVATRNDGSVQVVALGVLNSTNIPGTYNDGAWHHFSLNCIGGNKATFYLDGILKASGTGAYAPISGVTTYLGGWGSTSAYFVGQIDEVGFFAAAQRYVPFTPPTAPGPVDAPGQVALYHLDGDGTDSNTAGQGTRVVCAGNSLTWGYSNDTTAVPYPAVLGQILGGAYSIQNSGIGGQDGSQILANFQAQVGQYYRPGRQNILLLWEGTNDLYDNYTAAQALAHLQGVAAAWRALDPTNLVYCATVMCRSEVPNQGGVENTPAAVAAFEAGRTSLNASIRTSASWDRVIDLAADTRFGVPGCQRNTTWYDGSLVHLARAGYAAVADQFAAVVNAAVAATGSTPGSTDPGVSNVKVGTTYTIAGVSKVGTYDVSTLYTDPGVANVLAPTTYEFAGVTKQGTATQSGGGSGSGGSAPTVAQIVDGIGARFGPLGDAVASLTGRRTINPDGSVTFGDRAGVARYTIHADQSVTVLAGGGF